MYPLFPTIGQRLLRKVGASVCFCPGSYNDANLRWRVRPPASEVYLHGYETGWLQDDDGKWYYLNNDGSMAYDTVIDGYKLGSDGSWSNSNTSSNYGSTQLTSLGAGIIK